MFVSKAKLLCPALVILPYEFEKYEFATTKLYNVLAFTIKPIL